jgi:hypothetical protein
MPSGPIQAWLRPPSCSSTTTKTTASSITSCPPPRRQAHRTNSCPASSLAFAARRPRVVSWSRSVLARGCRCSSSHPGATAAGSILRSSTTPPCCASSSYGPASKSPTFPRGDGQSAEISPVASTSRRRGSSCQCSRIPLP